jgi:hypothetical protein
MSWTLIMLDASLSHVFCRNLGVPRPKRLFLLTLSGLKLGSFMQKIVHPEYAGRMTLASFLQEPRSPAPEEHAPKNVDADSWMTPVPGIGDW